MAMLLTNELESAEHSCWMDKIHTIKSFPSSLYYGCMPFGPIKTDAKRNGI